MSNDTDVPLGRAVMRDFGTPQAAPLSRLGLGDLPGLRLPAGSMGPKIEACGRFTAATGRPSAIGALRDAAAVLDGRAGTAVVPDRLDQLARTSAQLAGEG